MPQCHKLIQLFSDRAESTVKEFILLMGKAICNAKDEIQKEKRLPSSEGHFISVFLSSNKCKKTHGTKHYAQKWVISFSSCSSYLPPKNMHDEFAGIQLVDNTNLKYLKFFEEFFHAKHQISYPCRQLQHDHMNHLYWLAQPWLVNQNIFLLDWS